MWEEGGGSRSACLCGYERVSTAQGWKSVGRGRERTSMITVQGSDFPYFPVDTNGEKGKCVWADVLRGLGRSSFTHLCLTVQYSLSVC